jgi:nitroimidazol reductase NimA-like FMN-containing flavoprotein (pyridoxamine 5'-phosphate oxidase superfamily)
MPGTRPRRRGQARTRLAAARGYWLATVRSDGSPHAAPVLAVWVDDTLHFAASPASRKGRHVARDPPCVITARSEPLDLVIEGEAARVRDTARLQRVADAYASKYEWWPTVRDGAFHDVEGAPTAGPPPYDVYEVIPAKAYAFPLDDAVTPTRWRFAGRS